ncbi:hypothetical protein ROV36_09240 [Pasteurella multocida]|uniref:hypothetical protein n=1 Tax=Pasteurella multocida TaxID=747 RepID=UPI0009F2545C|nr:hypothetical protein [Pasteurella multocida]MEB3450924.1 hypothetical protein [Pasteurella multocida]MEB3452663.1 hypothetical protein [Pasteurella multocida]MEB3455101.1 hypothetical protein [Pasteurella multocida]MEB3460564.1 hypothetical protein [Pasteurella multocida]MEB3462399.1 hypothetical protein [Pasteurella multocida]
MYHREGYTKFPYRPSNGSDDCQNPTLNVGGIDLVNHPEKIDEIPEITLLPELKQTLIELNNPNSPFITLGCSHWIEKCGGSHFSYIEFTFKDSRISNDFEFLLKLERNLHHFFIDKLTTGFTKEQRDYYATYLKDQSQVYYRKIQYQDDTELRNLLGLVFHFPDQQTVDLHYKALRHFLMQHLVLPS